MNGGLNANGNLNYAALTGNHQASHVVSGIFCPNDTSRMDFVIHHQPDAGLNENIHLSNTNILWVKLGIIKFN